MHLVQRDSVDFIFDDESETIVREIVDWWLTLKRTGPRWIRKRMGNSPIFKDDEEFSPLQAADLMAWLTAKRHATGEQREFAERLAAK